MSVTAPAGFRAAGVRAGLKASGRPDLALVVNDGPLDVAAGVYVGNRPDDGLEDVGVVVRGLSLQGHAKSLKAHPRVDH